MQIDVHRVDAEVARPDATDDRVEIGPVAIDEPAGGVDRVGDRPHLALEQSAGVGVGDHHARHVGTEPRGERRDIDSTFGGGGNVLDRVAGKGGGGGVGAVRGFGDQDDLAGALALRLQRGLNRQDAAQFAMRAGLGTHRHRMHPGQHHQPMRELMDHLQRALHRIDRLKRVDVREPGQPAIFSLSRGLCFIVHEPSGNSPRSIA